MNVVILVLHMDLNTHPHLTRPGTDCRLSQNHPERNLVKFFIQPFYVPNVRRLQSCGSYVPL